MNIFQKIAVDIINWIGTIHWMQRDAISLDAKNEIKEALAQNYFIIATRRQNHLSTFFIGLGHFFLTGRWGYYGHVLMNMEDEVASLEDFRLIEATSTGTHFSTFDEVFDGVDSVALIKPKSLTLEQWTAVMDKAKEQLGKPYDSLFDISNDQALSCVELIRTALRALPTYSTDFANFEKYIANRKNLTPQMFLDCTDFEVVLTVRVLTVRK